MRDIDITDAFTDGLALASMGQLNIIFPHSQVTSWHNALHA